MDRQKKLRDLSDLVGSMTKAEARQIVELFAEADKAHIEAQTKRDLSFLRMDPEDVAAIREAHEMCDQIYPED